MWALRATSVPVAFAELHHKPSSIRVHEGANDRSATAISSHQRVDLCECNWEDNRLLHLVRDLLLVFGAAYRSDALLSLRHNASLASLQHLEALHHTVTVGGLCRASPPLILGTNGFRQVLSNDQLQGMANTSTYTSSLKDICFPGLVALDLLCSQHTVVLKGRQGGKPSPGVEVVALRRIERMVTLLPLLADCLPASPWPLDLTTLSKYTQAWLSVSLETVREYPIYDGHAQHLSLRSMWPKHLQRCLPVAEQCWPRDVTSLSESCTRCCDPRFPRGQRSCFDDRFTFEMCCQPDEPEIGWTPAPEPIETLRDGSEAKELRELRAQLREGCGSQHAAHAPRADAWAELELWLMHAKKQQQGLQKVFPELDLLVSTKACVAPEVELPWFVVASGDRDSTISGVAIAAAHGAVCGLGIPVPGELTSHSATRVTMPCSRPLDVPETHRLEPYGLELMRACELSRGHCFCGTKWCDGPHGRCCREGAGTEWRKFGVLTGELRTNIAHFGRDALWLHRLFRGNTTLAALGIGSSEIDLVLTKHAATECIENGRCVKTGRNTIFEMEAFMAKLALKGIQPAPHVLHIGDPSREHPICFDVVVQRWRPWAIDGHSVKSFRAKALSECQVLDRGMRRKIVLILRDAVSRQWQDERALKQQLEVFATAAHSSLSAVTLGHLTPCQQVELLHDCMLLISVHGADLTNMIFLPHGAAVVEVAVECEMEGGSVDTPFWRGPGTLMNSSIYNEAVEIWRQQNAQGRCPRAGATQREWLQGFPISQFAKLARQINLLYTAVMDCSGAGCDGRDMEAVWDRGWCSSDTKKRQYIDIDVLKRLIPTLWAVFDGYLKDVALPL